jgi:hypothetical protein
VSADAVVADVGGSLTKGSASVYQLSAERGAAPKVRDSTFVDVNASARNGARMVKTSIVVDANALEEEGL